MFNACLIESHNYANLVCKEISKTSKIYLIGAQFSATRGGCPKFGGYKIAKIASFSQFFHSRFLYFPILSYSA
jgi:hypothetical protein